jgi:hypothetical protein
VSGNQLNGFICTAANAAAKTFRVSQLRKGQTRKLLQMRLMLDLVLRVVAGDIPTKRRQRQELGQVGENEASCVHLSNPGKMASQASIAAYGVEIETRRNRHLFG